MMSPEHRQFIESALEAMEDAGYNPERFAGEVGVYGSCNQESIARYKAPPEWLAATRLSTELAGGWFMDSLAPNVLFYLGMTGEALTLAPYCAGFHYGVHLACQSLLLRQVDLAIAGSVHVRIPQQRGYLHVPGGILSRDGHTYPFDARGTGTVLSSGVVTVVLKRLEDALASSDHIYAVIKGSAINNNGARSIQYGFPQSERLGQCIASAMATGDIDPATVSMVECYGIGQPMSDALEVDAMRRAFRGSGRGSCAIGSVKGNIGHCATAAGGTSFAKALLALHHRQIPATIHCDTPNPEIPFAETPFYVQREPADWEPACGVRRAGVNAVGGSGYNAHIVLEEAPPLQGSASAPSARHALVTLSARTGSALAEMRANLAEHLRRYPALPLADIAFTLNTGRKSYPLRWAAIARSTAELLEQLTGATTEAFVGEGSATTGADEGMLQPGTHWTLDLASQCLLAKAWLRGRQPDWDAYYRDMPARRLSLPTYPLARERHWLEAGHSY
jgi:polyketide synthase PksJ